MNFVNTGIDGVVIIEPDVYGDERGFFLEVFHADRYREQGGIDVHFVQDNHSCSKKGILRGLHAQLSNPQDKLVRVISGEVFDVAVDVRKGSKTYGQHVAVTLSAKNFRQLFIPAGFVHGFLVTSEMAEFEYKCSSFYDPSSEISVAWNDPDLAIPWPIDDPVLSQKDATARRLRDCAQELPRE